MHDSPLLQQTGAFPEVAPALGRLPQTTLEDVGALEHPRSAEAAPGLLGDLMQLTKARLSLLVVVTTWLGYCMAAQGPIDWARLFHAIFGTAIAAAAAAVLNQVAESDVDRLMERTRHRPIPGGRIRRGNAAALGLFLCVAGCSYLWLTVSVLSAVLAAGTVALYLFLYTPMKRRTPLCTLAGAVAGAIPPMIGWVAARPSLDFGAWVLFGILFTWQMPHFLAIAWMYRDEYAQAGFVMLPRDDYSGAATAMQSLLYTLALGLISVLPFAAGLTTSDYLMGALALDSMFLLLALQFLFQRERASARALFLGSIIYLPLMLGLMVCTKV
jgi:protoheme IX farnesyltransferase